MAVIKEAERKHVSGEGSGEAENWMPIVGRIHPPFVMMNHP